MVGLKPLIITAFLQQGVAVDFRYGLSLDGLLTSQIRSVAATKTDHQQANSLLDGGLHLEEPKIWEIPLMKCEEGEDWHWMTTTGFLTNIEGTPVQYIPDTHLLLNEINQNRAREIAVKLPQEVGGGRGRFKKKLTPVLTIPAQKIIWHAIGNREEIFNLLNPIRSIGARRNSGEGTILAWSVEEASTEDYFLHGHTHPDGSLGKPAPKECVGKLNIEEYVVGEAGIHPPLFHSSTQRMLALPVNRLGIEYA